MASSKPAKPSVPAKKAKPSKATSSTQDAVNPLTAQLAEFQTTLLKAQSF